jgi:hypothetical protein
MKAGIKNPVISVNFYQKAFYPGTFPTPLKPVG